MSEPTRQPQTEAGPVKKPGLLRRARGAVGFVGRAYVRLQFGDMKRFVEEQKRFGGWVKQQVFARREGRQETFDEAVSRLGLGPEDLQARLSDLVRISWVYGAISAIAFAALLLAPFVKHAASQFLVSLALLVLMGARCVVTRFRIAQIRQRRLMGFFEWIRGEGAHGRVVR